MVTKDRIEESDAMVRALSDYLHGLEATDMYAVREDFASIIASQLSQIRLFRDASDTRSLLDQITLGRVEGSPSVALHPTSNEVVNAIVAHLKREPLVMDLTFKPDDGGISVSMRSEQALEGQDLSALGDPPASTDTPTFEDIPFGDEFWSAEETARHFTVSKSTITRRIQQNEMIGFRQFKNALFIPKDQFDAMVVVDGVKQILSWFDNDHAAAWRFLSTAFFYGSPHPRPIDRLRAAKGPSARERCLDELKAAKAGDDFGDHV